MSGFEFIVLLLLFVAFLVGAFVFFDRLETTASELRSHKAMVSGANLTELFVNMSPQAFFFFRSTLTFLAFVFGFFALNFFFGIFLALGAYIFPGVIRRRLRESRVMKMEQQLVEGLELMGNALKSGLTLTQAVELLVKEFPPPISQEFSMVMAENRLGVEFTEALGNMAKRLNSTIISVLVTGIAIVKRCGGDMTVIFASIASVIREQANITGKMNAVTAQGRFQGLILSAMPFGLIVILWFVDRTHVETLFGYQMGLFAMATVVIMVILANMWIRKLLEIDV